MAKYNSTLTQVRLKELLHYDAETGLFTWLVSRKGRFVRAGQIARANNHSGYKVICIDGICYRAHRLAWLYIKGRWPQDQIDHINGTRNDNVFTNLREVDNKTNAENIRSPRPTNKLGILGVHLHGRKFRAKIRLEGKEVMLGSFETKEEAHNAYIEAKRKHHKGCTI